MSVSRTCTILFTDLVGSTELRTRLGDDEFDIRRRSHDQLLADNVERQHGEVVKFGGDGVMAVFGSSADALACAVAMQQAVARDRSQEGTLEVRVGVSAGDVVEEEGDFHGTPVVEAARLCAAAQGAQILVADVVRVLAGTRGGHQFASMGELALKGLPDPLLAWEVPWSADRAHEVQVPVRLAEVSARGRCVGREEELDVLVDAWKRVITGERRLVLVAGEPGIGKTRLAAELAARVVDHGGVALHGWCDEDMGAPFQPWVQAINAYVRAADTDDLTEAVAGIGAELARLAPDLGARFPTLAPATGDAEIDRSRVVEAVDVFLERISTAHPLLLVLDDLHWADRPTLSLLVRLLRSDRAGSILLVGTYRDTDVDRRHPLADTLGDLRREPRATRVSLDGLDEVGLGALLADRAGHDAPDNFVQLISEGTDGNPFFVEEVLAHLVETGALLQREGVWVTDLAPDEFGLPAGVRDVVGRRLSRLSDEANDLLTVAAVTGREFDLGTVIKAGRFERDTALDLIESALATRLVVEIPGRAGRYAFSHALVRQTLEEEISGPKRARLHWRVGEALAAQRDPLASAVAFHFCEGVLAGDAEVAASAAMDAAESAGAIGAAEETNRFAQRCLEVLGDAEIDRPDLECRAQMAIGEAQGYLQLDFPGARAALVAAAEIAKENEWPEFAARAALIYRRIFVPGTVDPVGDALVRAALELGGGGEWQPALIASLGGAIAVEGRWEEGIALIDEAIALSANSAPGIRALTLLVQATIMWGSPDGSISKIAADEALEIADATGAAYLRLNARMSLGVSALRIGDREEFRRQNRALHAAVEQGTQTHLQMVWDCTEALLDARLDDAMSGCEELLASVPADSGFFVSATAQLGAIWYWSGRDEELLSALELFSNDQPGLRTTLDAVRASCLARAGKRAESRAYYEPLAKDGFAHLTNDFNRPGLLCHLANTAIWLEDRENAADLDDLLAPYGSEFFVAAQGCLVYDSVESIRGGLMSLLGHHDQAVAFGEAATDRCTHFGNAPAGVKNDRTLAATLLARGAPGDRDRAEQLATAALTRATEVGLAPDVTATQAILDRLG